MQPPLAYPLFVFAAALLQLPWIFQLWAPIATYPSKVHAHLSAFSEPRWSYQALSCGSVSTSLSSCPVTFASAERPWLRPRLVGAPGSQPGSPSRLKKKPHCTRVPLIVPELCHAQ